MMTKEEEGDDGKLPWTVGLAFKANNVVLVAKWVFFKLISAYLIVGGMLWVVLGFVFWFRGEGLYALVAFGVLHVHVINTELYYKMKSWELHGVKVRKEES